MEAKLIANKLRAIAYDIDKLETNISNLLKLKEDKGNMFPDDYLNKDINKYQFLLHIQIDKWNRIIELAKIEKVYHNVYRR